MILASCHFKAWKWFHDLIDRMLGSMQCIERSMHCFDVWPNLDNCIVSLERIKHLIDASFLSVDSLWSDVNSKSKSRDSSMFFQMCRAFESLILISSFRI